MGALQRHGDGMGFRTVSRSHPLIPATGADELIPPDRGTEAFVMRIGLAESSVGTPDQEEVLRAIRSGPRGEVPLPFRTMLDAPELVALLQAIGEYIRF